MPWRGSGEPVSSILRSTFIPGRPDAIRPWDKVFCQPIGSCTSDVLEPIDDLVSGGSHLNSHPLHQN